MKRAEEMYYEIGKSLPEAVRGNMFGWKCFKYHKKPFLFFDKNSEESMVFKLDISSLHKAITLKGSKIFNPSDKGNGMKNWVVVHYNHNEIWKELALKAYQNIHNEVVSTNKKSKVKNQSKIIKKGKPKT